MRHTPEIAPRASDHHRALGRLGLVASALAIAACGTSSRPHTKTSSSCDANVKIADCMRAHRVSNFPDPSASVAGEGGGGFSIQYEVNGSSGLMVNGVSVGGPAPLLCATTGLVPVRACPNSSRCTDAYDTERVDRRAEDCEPGTISRTALMRSDGGSSATAPPERPFHECGIDSPNVSSAEGSTGTLSGCRDWRISGPCAIAASPVTMRGQLHRSAARNPRVTAPHPPCAT